MSNDLLAVWKGLVHLEPAGRRYSYMYIQPLLGEERVHRGLSGVGGKTRKSGESFGWHGLWMWTSKGVGLFATEGASRRYPSCGAGGNSNSVKDWLIWNISYLSA